MPQYTLAVVSDRSTFKVPLDASDDDDVLARAIKLLTKARVPVGATVTIQRGGDQAAMDVSAAVASHLDRPGL